MSTTPYVPPPLIPFDPAPLIVPGGTVTVSGILCADLDQGDSPDVTGTCGVLHGDVREALLCRLTNGGARKLVRASVLAHMTSAWLCEPGSIGEMEIESNRVLGPVRRFQWKWNVRADDQAIAEVLRSSLKRSPSAGVHIAVFAPTPDLHAECDAIEKGMVAGTADIKIVMTMVAKREAATRTFRIADLAKEIARLRIASPIRKQPKSAARQVA